MSPQPRTESFLSMESNEEMMMTRSVEEPKQHTTSRRPRRNRRNGNRGGYITLVPGSPFHDAFFGNDESLRSDFNCEDHHYFCNSRDLTRSTMNGNESSSTGSFRSLDSRRFLRQRQDSDLSQMSDASASSTTSAAAYKAGRPMLPRYAEF